MSSISASPTAGSQPQSSAVNVREASAGQRIPVRSGQPPPFSSNPPLPATSWDQVMDPYKTPTHEMHNAVRAMQLNSEQQTRNVDLLIRAITELNSKVEILATNIQHLVQSHNTTAAVSSPPIPAPQINRTTVSDPYHLGGPPHQPDFRCVITPSTGEPYWGPVAHSKQEAKALAQQQALSEAQSQPPPFSSNPPLPATSWDQVMDPYKTPGWDLENPGGSGGGCDWASLRACC
jgi:hypothetical protein